MDKFSINSSQNGKVTIVNISGRVDSATAPAMDAKLEELMRHNKKLVLDLSTVEFLSSAGVRAVVSALKTARKSRGEVRLASVPTNIADVLRTLGIMELVQEYPTVDQAVAGF